MDVVKIADLRINLKSITDNIINSGKPVIVAGPKNKNLVLLPLEYFNHLNSKNMEQSAEINYKDDYRYSESLHASAEGLIGAYSRILRKFPEHPDAAEWKTQKEYWPKYKNKIKDFVFKTEIEAVNETNRIGAILKKILSDEQIIASKANSKSLSFK